METRIICAGFGGQGIMSMGRLIAYTGMQNGKEVSWLPSYGPEMRGGTANCNAIVSDVPIASPVISGNADVVVAMNLPSMRKFESELIPGGILLYNSSLIGEAPARSDVRNLPVDATGQATELGNAKTANMVILGALLTATELFRRDQIVAALKEVFGSAKDQFLPLNTKALDRGLEINTARTTPAGGA